ncbi:MAG: hypothetical protein ACXABY_02725 [Candidatus Thorarchaeota archaeon]|jgi:hypothetical protein
MAAAGKITVGFDVQEIGAVDWDGVLKAFNITTTPDTKFYNHPTQAVADTEEAIAVGDVGTIEYMIVHCITNDCDLDTNFVTAFKASQVVQEGEWACFKPSGTVYMKNNDAAEQSLIEYWLIGTK